MKYVQDDKGNVGILLSKKEWDAFNPILGFSERVSNAIHRELLKSENPISEYQRDTLRAILYKLWGEWER